MPKISVHDLMTISRILLLIIGQNDLNPKLLQPIDASICKVMTVKKPCVCKPHFFSVPWETGFWSAWLAGTLSVVLECLGHVKVLGAVSS